MNAPLEGSIAIPAAIAAASSENVSVSAGSSSVAVAVNDSRVSSSTVLLPIAPSSGASCSGSIVIETVAGVLPKASPSNTLKAKLSGALEFRIGV